MHQWRAGHYPFHANTNQQPQDSHRTRAHAPADAGFAKKAEEKPGRSLLGMALLDTSTMCFAATGPDIQHPFRRGQGSYVWSSSPAHLT